MEILRIDNLTVTYRYGALAVSDLSFVAKKGITCIVGEEESGKTTLLKTLAGLVQPTSGRIFFDEKDGLTMPIRERNVCLLYEDGGFFENRTSEYNLRYVLKVRKIPENEWENRIVEVAEKSGFDPKLLQTPVRKLSKEDRVLLAYARAFLRKADLYLIDDSIRTVSDRESLFQRIAPLVEELSKNAVVLYATDSIAECERFGGEAVFLRYGICPCVGTIEEISKNPPDLFIAEKLCSNAKRDTVTLLQEGEEILFEGFGKQYRMKKEGLLSDVFLNKPLVALEIGEKLHLFDLRSERKVYFS